MPNYLYSASICNHCSCDTDDVLIGCQGTNKLLCLSHSCCLSLNGKQYGVGLVTELGDICRLGAYVCTTALKKPSTCCATAGQVLCMKNASLLPFDEDYVKEPICACCFVKLLPVNDVGVLKEVPTCNKFGR